MRSGGREGVTNRTDVRVCPDGGGECAKHGLKHRCCVLVPTGLCCAREFSHCAPPPPQSSCSKPTVLYASETHSSYAR